VIPETLGLCAALYAALVAHARLRGGLAGSAYISPIEADAELDSLAAASKGRARVEEYGRSTQGRALRLLRIGGATNAEAPRARLLVTAQIHAGEFVGGYVARAVARALLESQDPDVLELLENAEVLVAPLLNPDGAQRVWDANGWAGFRGLRVTANGADPNRNFPYVPRQDGEARERSWNSARSEVGTAHYRGAQPLSEPECAALAELAARERFCGALNFHSFGGIVYLPVLLGVFDAGDDSAARGLAAIAEEFPARQVDCAYRVVPEHPDAIEGQLDAFLLGAFGTPSATVEVGRPGVGLLKPSRFLNPFWIFNPERPERWAKNDVAATIRTLVQVVRSTGGKPGAPRQPELAEFRASG
jgi:hypothetical protein